MARIVNVSSLIDDGPISRLQIAVVVLCGLVNVLDGADTQSIGVAAPFIAGELHVPLAQFGPIFSAALLGATLGAIGFGMIADRIGRKPLLIVSMAIIGVFTLLTAHAPSREGLIAFRLLAGIGLGGATPCFIALTSEYAPARVRATWVTLMWSGFPIGAMIGGFTNSLLLPVYGWRAIFYVGGTFPLLLAVVLLGALPESLKFLVLRPGRMEAARRIAQRLRPAVGAEMVLVADDDRLPGLPLRRVFAEGRAAGTLLLWVPFFTGFGMLTVAVLWTPSLLRANGISAAATAFVVAFNGLGAAVGQAGLGQLLRWFGVTATVVASFVLGALATVGLGYGAGSVALAAIFIGLNGFFIGIGTAGAIVMAASLYPTAARSSGVGLAMATGRFGQVVGPLVAGGMLGLGLSAGQIMLVMGAAGLIGAVFAALFQAWAAHRGPVLAPAVPLEAAIVRSELP